MSHFHVLVLDRYVSGEKVRTFIVRKRDHLEIELARETDAKRNPQYRECDDKCLGPEYTVPGSSLPWAPIA